VFEIIQYISIFISLFHIYLSLLFMSHVVASYLLLSMSCIKHVPGPQLTIIYHWHIIVSMYYFFKEMCKCTIVVLILRLNIRITKVATTP